MVLSSEQITSFRIKAHSDARDFLCRARPFLETSPDTNHHIIQVATLAATGSDYLRPPFEFWSIEDKQGELLGCAVHVRPDGLILSDLPERAIASLFSVLGSAGTNIERVVCPQRRSSSVLAALCDINSSVFHHEKSWTVGRLDKVPEGRQHIETDLRVANRCDESLILAWARQYQRDEPSFLDVPDFMALKLANGELYILEDDGNPKSMATVSGRTALGARISSVFTDVDARGKGYAKSLVTDLSRALLRDGSRFVILTWTQGGAAGDLYQSIGFRPVAHCESHVIAPTK